MFDRVSRFCRSERRTNCFMPSTLRMRCRANRHPRGQRQRAEVAQDQLHSGNQLPVARMLDRRIAKAVEGQRLGGRRVTVEQLDEPIERGQPSLARPQDSILEGVRDPEQKVGDADLIARWFGQEGDRQREGPARLLQQVVND